MFITCQECNTTFRLDERLLKPTGSKVRCSQCLHTFVVMPQASPPRPAEKQTVSVAPPTGPAAAATAEQEIELEGLDLAELDALLEGSETEHDPQGDDIAAESGETDELDLDLDFDFDAALDPEFEKEAAPADEVQTTVDELDLEMDFEIEEPFTLGDQTAGVEPAGDAASAAEETLREASLEDDLELTLEGLNLETEGKRTSTPPPPKKRQTNDLDLADLDLDLDLDGDADVHLSDVEDQELSLADEAAADHAAEAAGLGPEASGNDPDPDLEDLDLEFEEADESSEENDDIEPELELDDPPGKSADNLDLSDLDGILDDPGEAVETAGSEPELQLDDDPDLHLDIEDQAAPEEKNADAAENEFDELDFDFELDGELDDNSAEPSLSLADEDDILPEEDEIDLSDIEEMLGNGGEETKAGVDRSDDEEFDLGGEGGEIDLSELESAIDQAEEAPGGPGAMDEQELELELEMDSTSSSQKDEIADDGVFTDDLKLELADGENDGETDELDLELEFEMESDAPAVKSAQPMDEAELDLSDLADLVDGGRQGSTSQVVDGGDIELEFHIEEDEDEKAAAAATAGEMHAVPIEETVESSAAKRKPVKTKSVKPKKKSSKSLVFLLFLLLLAMGAYGVYYAVTQMGVTIPYVSDYLKPAPSDPGGTLNLSTLDINSKFIENSSSGRLFVITGKVRNGYGSPRRSIRLLGNLFTKGKVLVQSEYTYAGAVVADADLAGLPIAEIKQRLNRNDAAAVRPGQNTPFMIVFSDLPPAEQLDEFAVELVSSAPVTR